MTTASSLRRHGSIAPTGRGIAIGPLHPAHRYGRSIFPSRVYDPGEVKRVLKTGHQSRKIGKTVHKGPRRGWPIFTLTLEERATCPRTCKAFGFCFGNNMQAAERIVAGPELEAALWSELEALQAEHPAGFMVRLHVLGDFYSVDYVRLWGGGAGRLSRAPRLRLHRARSGRRDRPGAVRPCRRAMGAVRGALFGDARPADGVADRRRR